MVNKFILQGRLTADPELKQTQSGVSCANLTIAWSEKYKETETKCFQRCKAWRSTADFIITSEYMNTEYKHDIINFRKNIEDRANTL